MKYTATFEVPAIVHVSVVVDEDNQTEALAQAFDEILYAKVDQAQIVSMMLDNPKNIGLTRETPATWQNPAIHRDAPEANVEPVQPAAAQQTASAQSRQVDAQNGYPYELQLFAGNPDAPDATPVRTVPYADLAAANDALIEDVLKAGSRYGGGQLVDLSTGATVSRGKNARGDWEVHAYRAAQDRAVSFETWLSREAALQTATRFATQQGVQRVVIVNYTDRAAGPQPFRTIE